MLDFDRLGNLPFGLSFDGNLQAAVSTWKYASRASEAASGIKPPAGTRAAGLPLRHWSEFVERFSANWFSWPCGAIPQVMCQKTLQTSPLAAFARCKTLLRQRTGLHRAVSQNSGGPNPDWPPVPRVSGALRRNNSSNARIMPSSNRRSPGRRRADGLQNPSPPPPAPRA